ncbi:MAG TPA: universal stress protein [Rhodobacteraceae bacterium]|nr:universal stress protein [Paracoccaceae bacterium]
MDYKTISTVVTDAAMLEHVLNNASVVARSAGAHLDVLCLGLDRTRPDFYYAGGSAVLLQDNLAQAHAQAEMLEAAVRTHLATADFNWSATGMTTQIVTLNGLIAHRVRFSDLVVLPRPYGEDRGHEYEAILEAALFNGDVPVLVLPDGKVAKSTPERIVLAWNDSTEAMRAARAALPYLTRSGDVCITIIDPPPHGPERSDPGGGLSQWLSRHGVRAEVSVLARTLPRISDVLNRHVTDRDADLVVMGAYGHSRFREAIMGGATRHMLELAEVPVLMMH